MKTNLMESADCKSRSGLCRYAAPFGLESGRSNARYLCQCRRWRRSNCASRGLLTMGAKGTQMTAPVGALYRTIEPMMATIRATITGTVDVYSIAPTKTFWF